jgi:putative ABC transport system substrate-binding protein
MRRREFIAGLGGAVAWPFTRPLAAEGQRRVGVLTAADNNPRSQSFLRAFREGLATFGWVEGRNLRIDYSFAATGDPGRLVAYAEELVNLRPEVIFAIGGLAAAAVQQRTSVIPIVFVGGADVTGSGLVRNIARPEGNVTGFANVFVSLWGRWLELFKEAVPRLTRVAWIAPANASDLFPRNTWDNGASFAAEAAQLGVTAIPMLVRNEVELENAIGAFAAEPGGGLLMNWLLPFFPSNPTPTVDVIGRLALYHHLPFMIGGGNGRFLPEGVLMRHGPDPLDPVRPASSYVDRILRGAKPSELPVQYPTKFELVVNLKTAKAIGVTIPETFLARADEVIE